MIRHASSPRATEGKRPIAAAHAICSRLHAAGIPGVDLKNLEAKGVVQSGPDGEGYSYKLSLCSEIPAAQLPTGCQQYAEQHVPTSNRDRR